MNKNIKTQLQSALLVLLAGFVLSSCMGGKQAINAIFQARTPHEAYEHHLKEAKLDKTTLGQTWIAAGNKALQDSFLISLPFQETGYFTAEKPRAAAYSFRAKQGELIEVKVTTRTKGDIKLFLDLFEVATGTPRETKHVAAADTTALSLQYKVDETLVHLVRLQPELLKSGSFTISIVSGPSLSFPVQGKGNKAIQSFWGADRDGGSRKHEGVDIFAAKGTPVVAGTHGRVSRVSETPIGGKVVWLTDLKSNQNIYYAHLDKQLVQEGQEVKPGDILGLVGNTGNARGTVPHLHFGVYTFGRGPVDPFPFIYQSDQKPAPLRVAENQIGQWNRVSQNNGTIRQKPDAAAAKITVLAKNTPLQILGGVDEWFRVQLPDGVTGFIHKKAVESLTKPVRTHLLKTDIELIQEPLPVASPIALVKKNTSVNILGIFQGYNLVKLADGTLGWFLKS